MKKFYITIISLLFTISFQMVYNSLSFHEALESSSIMITLITNTALMLFDVVSSNMLMDIKTGFTFYILLYILLAIIFLTINVTILINLIFLFFYLVSKSLLAFLNKNKK